MLLKTEKVGVLIDKKKYLKVVFDTNEANFEYKINEVNETDK